MDVGTARNVRDKARMKEVLRAAGHAVRPAPAGRPAPTRRSRSPRRSGSRSSPSRLPGAGAQATYRLDDADALRGWLAAVPPRAGGARRCWRSSSSARSSRSTACRSAGTTVWASVSDYLPPPLEVLRNPWIQWTVLLPREHRRARATPASGEVGAGRRCGRSGVRDGLTHMEWFRRPDGSVAVSEVGARPPGAQITSMLGYVHDVDFYRLWARAGDARPVRPAGAEVRGGQRLPARAGPRARSGPCTASTSCSAALGHLVVEARLPEAGPAGVVGATRARAT